MLLNVNNSASNMHDGFVVRDSTQKEGRNVLFNDTLNKFYLWLCGIRHDKEPLR